MKVGLYFFVILLLISSQAQTRFQFSVGIGQPDIYKVQSANRLDNAARLRYLDGNSIRFFYYGGVTYALNDKISLSTGIESTAAGALILADEIPSGFTSIGYSYCYWRYGVPVEIQYAPIKLIFIKTGLSVNYYDSEKSICSRR